MKQKILFSILLLYFSCTLWSLRIISANKTIDIDRSYLKKFAKTTISTMRNKDGKTKNDEWVGVNLIDVLRKEGLKPQNELKISSFDHYLVRIKWEDILDHPAILALKRNGKELSAKKIRLVTPDLRDMFWIQNIEEILLENSPHFPPPDVVYNALTILNTTSHKDPQPFVSCSGWYFEELIDKVFPDRYGEYLLIGKDGIKHILDYDKYLKNAVLVKTEETLFLKSPNMPAGMWIKDLALIQKDKKSIFCLPEMKGFAEINHFISHKIDSVKVLVTNINKSKKLLDIGDSFTDWKQISKLEIRKKQIPSLKISGNIPQISEISQDGSLKEILSDLMVEENLIDFPINVLLIAKDGLAVLLPIQAYSQIKIEQQNGLYNSFSETLPPVCNVKNIVEISVFYPQKFVELDFDTVSYTSSFQAKLQEYNFLGESASGGITVKKYRYNSPFKLQTDGNEFMITFNDNEKIKLSKDELSNIKLTDNSLHYKQKQIKRIKKIR